MANKARIVDGVAVDVTPADQLANRWHGDLLAEFVDVPDDVVDGSRQASDGTWTPPPTPPALPPPLPPPEAYAINRVAFMLRFTIQERLVIRELQKSDAIVGDFMDLLSDPAAPMVILNDPGVEQGLGYLAGLSTPPISTPAITPERIPALLAPIT